MTKLKVLVACEYSGLIRNAFAEKGHEAYSCDILDTESPGNHIKDDVLNHLDKDWDLMIANPPCTHLAVSGARWFKNKNKEQELAIQFVKKLFNADIEKICIENPVSVLSTQLRLPDQTVHPYYFGDPYQKKTCFWLKNLSKLVATHPLGPEPLFNKDADKGEFVNHGGKKMPKWYSNKERNRDMSFPGMAKAMADQWG